MIRENDEWYIAAEANALNIETRLFALNTGHWNDTVRCYKDFVIQAKEIYSLIYKLDPLLTEDRERLLAGLRKTVYAIQLQYKPQDAALFVNSLKIKNMIISGISEICGRAKVASSLQEFKDVQELRNKVMPIMNSTWIGFVTPADSVYCMDGDPGRMKKTDYDACSMALRDLNIVLNDRKKEINGENVLLLNQLISEVRNKIALGKFQKAKESITGIQQTLSSLYFERPDFELLNKTLLELWSIVNHELIALNKVRRLEYARWIDRQNARIEKMEKSISKKENFIDRLEAVIESLLERKSGTRSEDFAFRLQESIARKENTIKACRFAVNSQKDKIRAIKDKMS